MSDPVSVDQRHPIPSWRALASSRRGLRAAIAILGQATVVPRESVEAVGQALAELRVAEGAQDVFVAATVHELRTSVTAIKGQAQLLRSQADRDGLDEDRLAAGLARIDAAADALASALDALLAETERPLPEAEEPSAPEPGGPVAGER